MIFVLRVLLIIPTLICFANVVGFLFTPAETAASLGMTMLEGAGGNSQIGDFAAFFFAASTLLALGVWKLKPEYLIGGGLLMGGAGVFRLLVQALHGLPAPAPFLVVEFTTLGLVVLLIYFLNKQEG